MCRFTATAVEEEGDKMNKEAKPYHLDNKSPQVSRIFSAHSLETSPDPLSNGSSLSGQTCIQNTLSGVDYCLACLDLENKL